MFDSITKLFSNASTEGLGERLFAVRFPGGDIPPGCIAYELLDGERGSVEFSGTLRLARGQVFYLLHPGPPYRVRFAPDPKAPEYGIELELTLADTRNPPEALANLIAELRNEEGLPKQLDKKDLANAAALACGDDIFLTCMSAEEWDEATRQLGYRLGKRFGLAAKSVKPVSLGAADEVDAALAALRDLERADLERVDAAGQSQATTGEGNATAQTPLQGPVDGRRDAGSEPDRTLLEGVARSFRLSLPKMRAPSLRPAQLDWRLRQRLSAQLPGLGKRIEALGHAGTPAARRQLRALRDRVWAAESGLGYLGDLEATAQGKLKGRALRRRLVYMRDASDALEALWRQLADLEQAGPTAPAETQLAALQDSVELLQAALARRAFREV